MATWAPARRHSPLGDDELIPVARVAIERIGRPFDVYAVCQQGVAVAGSVALAAVRGDVAQRDARLHQFLESGRNIATGGLGRLPAATG